MRNAETIQPLLSREEGGQSFAAPLVLDIVDKLYANGVHAIVDEYDLKPGQDIHAFMESSILDTNNGHILLMCDKAYQEKANAREGGVGAEVSIYTPEVYGNVDQQRIIPVVLETDEQGHACVPMFVKSRYYVDLSAPDRFEEAFESLLRTILDVPKRTRPRLGSVPDFLTSDEPPSYAGLQGIARQMQNLQTPSDNVRYLFNRLSESVVPYLDELAAHKDPDTDLPSRIDKTRPIRDLLLQIFRECVERRIVSGTELGEFIETLYNGITPFTPQNQSIGTEDEEHYHFFFWELFVCVVTLLIHTKSYKDLHDFVFRTYFLKDNWCTGSCEKENDFRAFRKHLKSLESKYNQPNNGTRRLSITADTFVAREFYPIWTKKNTVDADLVLFQLAEFLLRNSGDEFGWFPMTHIYSSDQPSIWKRMVSRTHCQKLLPLFGCASIKTLKEELAKAEERTVRYNGHRGFSMGFQNVPGIFSAIRLDQIASRD